MVNEGDYLSRNFYAIFPLLLFLWVLPWAMLAAWIDRESRQFNVSTLMWLTLICCVELGAGSWLGYLLIAGGILGCGFLIFLPSLAIYRRRRKRRQRLQQLGAAAGADNEPCVAGAGKIPPMGN